MLVRWILYLHEVACNGKPTTNSEEKEGQSLCCLSLVVRSWTRPSLQLLRRLNDWVTDPFPVPTQRKSKNLAKTKKHHPWAAPVVHCYIQESFREPPRCSGDEEIQFLSRVGHFLIEHSNANKRRGIQFRISSHLEPFVVELFCLKSESIVYWQKDQPFESPPKMLLFNGQQNSERVETKDVSSQNVWKPRHILLYKNRVSKALQVREEAKL